MSLSDETTFHAPPRRCGCMIVDLGLEPVIAYCAKHSAAAELMDVLRRYTESDRSMDEAHGDRVLVSSGLHLDALAVLAKAGEE